MLYVRGIFVFDFYLLRIHFMAILVDGKCKNSSMFKWIPSFFYSWKFLFILYTIHFIFRVSGLGRVLKFWICSVQRHSENHFQCYNEYLVSEICRSFSNQNNITIVKHYIDTFESFLTFSNNRYSSFKTNKLNDHSQQSHLYWIGTYDRK